MINKLPRDKTDKMNATNRALNRLKKAHLDEFNQYFVEEMEYLGYRAVSTTTFSFEKKTS